MAIKDNGDIITLDLAQQESDKGWLSLYWRYYSMLAGVMADNQGANDYRIELITNLAIATLPDPDIRSDIRDRKEEMLMGITTDNAEDKNREIMNICMIIIGDVTSEIDKSIGIHQKIGICIE